jgi:outer membrane protein assembly factor BamB
MKTNLVAGKGPRRTGRTVMRRLALRAVLALTCGLALTACSERELILDGERVAVIDYGDRVAVDPAALAEGAGLSPALSIIKAGHPGLNAGHAGGNPGLALPIDKRWSARIGDAGNEFIDLAPPVVAKGRVYTVAPSGLVSAFAVDTGKTAWQISIEAKTDDPLPGTAGGIAFGIDRLFAHAGGTVLAAIAPDDGSVIWSVQVPIALRGGPTAVDDKGVVVTDLDGNVMMYDAKDGTLVWERAGLPVTTVVYGAPSPAVSGNTMVVAGYGGDVSVIEVNSGQVVWTDTLAAFNPRTPLQGLGDITAHPVHDGGLIFVVSQAGQIAAYNAQSGLLLWDRPVGGTAMPWISGKTLFLVTADGRLYALRRSDGAVRWVAELPGAVPPDMVAAENAVRYIGPFVAGGRVFVISQAGKLMEFDADTGAAGKTRQIAGETTTAPQFSNDMMFVLGRNGTLTAYQ